MMLWVLLVALLAQLGTGLPIASLVADLVNADDGDYSLSTLLSNVTGSPAFVSHDTAVSPRSRIVKRTTWPWDPPSLYDEVEIYTAFRAGALLLMEIMSHPETADQEYISFNGQRFPGEYRGRYRAPTVGIGLGTWRPDRAFQNFPVAERTSLIYEYPLIPGGNYPNANMGLGNVVVYNPGPDRVLFQLVRGLPLYLGVVSQRSGFHRRLDATGEDGRHSIATYSWYYPGMDALASIGGPSQGALRQRRVTRPINPIHPVAYSALPMSTPTPDPDPDAGGGASGGGSGVKSVGPGGYSESGGGAAGPQGGFEQYVAPIAGNAFKAGWSSFFPGPSHIEL
ncbi:hypothetical protein PG993_014024 [Apiospora rasikravindrae]|uniref:Uncharacterized protein n=1 Tax=Apiospora rasikravindrae TaxID=990691 RepID=A0ABR1RRV4_9PEZI